MSIDSVGALSMLRHDRLLAADCDHERLDADRGDPVTGRRRAAQDRHDRQRARRELAGNGDADAHLRGIDLDVLDVLPPASTGSHIDAAVDVQGARVNGDVSDDRANRFDTRASAAHRDRSMGRPVAVRE